MTDHTSLLLERLAETFPDRPTPLPELVAAAHAGRRRRTRRNVALAGGACVLAVGAGFAVQQVLPDDGTERSDRVADSRELCDRTALKTAPSWAPPQGPDYPRNASGETYGGSSGGKLPSLIAAVGDCGRTGYVRGTELDPPPWVPGAGSLGPLVVPLYESDGLTQVDTYTVGAETAPPSAPPSGPDAADVQGEWTATVAGVTNEDGVALYDTYRDLDLRITFDGDAVQLFDGCDIVRTTYALESGAFTLTDPDALLGGPAPSCARSAPLVPILRNVRHITEEGRRTYLHLANFQIVVTLTRP